MLGRICLDRVHCIGCVIDCNPIDVFERRKHFGTHLGIEDWTARTFVDEAVRSYGDDENVAELAGGFQMTKMAEMKKIERAVRLNDGLCRSRGSARQSVPARPSVRTLSRGPTTVGIG